MTLKPPFKPSKPLSLTKDEWRRLGHKRRLVVGRRLE